jgi:undecaprenyl-diphosphatase
MDVLAAVHGVDAWGFFAINQGIRNPLFDVLMPALGDKRLAILPGAVAALTFLVWRGRRAAGILLAMGLAVGLSDWTGALLKEAFQRIRPCHVLPAVHLLVGCTRSFSLPSNHAVNMAALATVAWTTRTPGRVCLAILAAGVAFSRVYVGAHYPGDVLVGALWGGAIGWLLSRAALRGFAYFPSLQLPQESAEISENSVRLSKQKQSAPSIPPEGTTRNSS